MTSVIALAAALTVAPAAPAVAAGDDYPTSIAGCRDRSNPSGTPFTCNLRNSAKDSLIDPWAFYNRNCTSFVAWRMNSANGVAFTNFMGGGRWSNANNWDDNARALGYPVNSTPARGAIAQTDTGSSLGHVAWVDAVHADGTVTIEEYNALTVGGYGRRTVAASSFVYIHVKDLPSSTTTVPGAPVIGRATPGNARVRVAFTPPTSDGGSAITSYTVTASPGGRTVTTTTSPVWVTGLTNGTAYTFTVRATNAAGTGPASAATKAVTPTNTRTALTSSANPSAAGQSVTLTAKVSATSPTTGTPTGNVTFVDGTTVLGSVPLDGSGVATFTTGPLTARTHSITATYAGGGIYTKSSANIRQRVG